jgi:hypothetical protein
VVLQGLNVALGIVSAIFARLEGLNLDAELSLGLLSVNVVAFMVSVDHVPGLTVLIAKLFVVLEVVCPLAGALIMVCNHPLLQNLSSVCLLTNVLIIFNDGGRKL